MVWNFFYFLVAIILLVGVHELGHFSVARLVGVQVLRFSFGFGPVIARFKDKRGTEFALSLLPFGGYVKMLGESDVDIAPHESRYAYCHQSTWKRMAIILAGPLFNLLFSILALWLVLMIGMQSFAPIIDKVIPGSVSADAGLQGKQEIVSLNEMPISSWRDFQYSVMPLLGSDAPIALGVRSLKHHQHKTVMLLLKGSESSSASQGLLEELGIVPFVPKISALVVAVATGTPAAVAGFQAGDHILAIGGKKISDWYDVVHYVRLHPGVKAIFSVLNQGTHVTRVVYLGRHREKGHDIGFLGVESQKVRWPPHWIRWHQETPLYAAWQAVRQTVSLTYTTAALMGRMVMGKLSWHSVSGPVGIALVAGDSARYGLTYYLSFLALLSVSLGVLNLLPIPLLDGGQALYLLIEWVLRRPLTNRTKIWGFQVGIVILMILMTVALKNDLTKL